MDNIILLLGGSSDIGIELIKNIKEECLILAHYFSSDKKLLEAKKGITNKLVTIQADLSSDVDLEIFLNEIEDNYGTPNKIVHLAATKFQYVRFKDLKWADFDKELSTSLKSAVLIFNRFLPKLAKEKRGKVVIVLSSSVIGVPPKFLAHYVTVKYALLGLMKSLATEYADKKITINAISPSMVETKFLKDINDKMIELSAYNNPLKRNAIVQDIVPAIMLLLSEGSSYMTGNNIIITGGSNF